MAEKPWEIWSEAEADNLEKAWGPPMRGKGRHQVLVEKVASLIRGKSVLDVGCGLGHLYGAIKNDVERYLGVDSSPAMVRGARSYFGEGPFKVGSAYDLSSVPIFDTVVCLDVVKHVSETWPILEQLWGKTGKEMILVTNIGEKATVRRTSRGKDKYLIYRVETLANLLKLFQKLPDKGKVEQYKFDDRKGTIIFRVTRRA